MPLSTTVRHFATWLVDPWFKILEDMKNKENINFHGKNIQCVCTMLLIRSEVRGNQQPCRTIPVGWTICFIHPDPTSTTRRWFNRKKKKKSHGIPFFFFLWESHGIPVPAENKYKGHASEKPQPLLSPSVLLNRSFKFS